MSSNLRTFSLGTFYHDVAQCDLCFSGTTASAATASRIVKRSAPPPAEVFHAVHPFIFIIAHKTSRTNLFMGRLVVPPDNLISDSNTVIGHDVEDSFMYTQLMWGVVLLLLTLGLAMSLDKVMAVVGVYEHPHCIAKQESIVPPNVS